MEQNVIDRADVCGDVEGGGEPRRAPDVETAMALWATLWSVSRIEGRLPAHLDRLCERRGVGGLRAAIADVSGDVAAQWSSIDPMERCLAWCDDFEILYCPDVIRYGLQVIEDRLVVDTEAMRRTAKDRIESRAPRTRRRARR